MAEAGSRAPPAQSSGEGTVDRSRNRPFLRGRYDRGFAQRTLPPRKAPPVVRQMDHSLEEGSSRAPRIDHSFGEGTIEPSRNGPFPGGRYRSRFPQWTIPPWKASFALRQWPIPRRKARSAECLMGSAPLHRGRGGPLNGPCTGGRSLSRSAQRVLQQRNTPLAEHSMGSAAENYSIGRSFDEVRTVASGSTRTNHRPCQQSITVREDHTTPVATELRC